MFERCPIPFLGIQGGGDFGRDLGRAGPNGLDTRRHFLGPRFLGVGIVLFVETLGEPQDQRGPLVDGQRQSLDGDGFSGTHGPSVFTDAPSSNLVTDGARVYFFDGHGTASAEVWSIRGVPVEASPIATVAAPAGHQLRLLAGGPAGLYVTYDCDCAPWLSRVVPGETEPSTLEGAGAVGVWGSYSVGVGPDRLYVAANPTSGGAALRRLPFAGGEAEELLGTGSRRTALTANHRHVCWLGGNYQGPTALRTVMPAATRCLALLDPRRPSREIDSMDSALTMSLALADDAVYWLRPQGDEDSAYEIFAAAL